MNEQTKKGCFARIIPFVKDVQEDRFGKKIASPIPTGYTDVRNAPDETFDPMISMVPVGQVCGTLNEIQSTKDVIEELMQTLEQTFADIHRRFL